MTSSSRDTDGDPQRARRELEAAARGLEPEIAWAREALRALRKRAAQRASSELSSRGEAERKLAERAGALGDPAAERAAMPGDALQALHEAERAAHEAASSLERGDAEEGLAEQRQAQRRLEAAREALGADRGEAGEGKGARGEESATAGGGHAKIPGVRDHQGPEEFRKRVLEGLGQPAASRYRDAVRRYGEGLLR